MKDRLKFETTVLDNGITVHAKPADVPFAYVRLYLPVGHVHNTGDILPGTAHFLEHMQCKRSALYPDCDSYDTFVALEGGQFNASTHPAWTEYRLKIPTTVFVPAFQGLISHVLEPIFDERDLEREIGIISSERRRRSRWYPGSDELEHHCLTKWKYDHPLTLRQIFGEDPDLKQMSVERLRRMHQAYLDPRAYMLVGGNFDRSLVFQELSRFPTAEHNLSVQIETLRWEHRQYHEEKFPSINRFIYHLGGIVPERDLQILQGNNFLGRLLVNTVHGTLYNWLRRELGWSYNLGFELDGGHPHKQADWELYLPVNSYEQAQQVRKEVHDRIRKAIHDQDLLATELRRRISGQVFWYQTIGQVIDEAHSSLIGDKKLTSELELTNLLKQCQNPSFLENIYERYWSPEVSGEFLAIPDNV